jgi:nucleotide-binding universal stress UspA family protein
MGGQTQRSICVAVDDSPQSERAWLWALDTFLRKASSWCVADQVTLVTVATVSSTQPLLGTLLPLSRASSVSEHAARQHAEQAATLLLQKYVDVGVASGVCMYKTLRPCHTLFNMHILRIYSMHDAVLVDITAWWYS